MFVEMIQHPVGQGGFFYGVLHYGDNKTFRWVYDCGSNDEEELCREINNIPTDKKIDILYMSHMHKDHINGFDELRKKVKIDRVVLPYFDEYEKLAILANYASKGQLTNNVRNFVVNPGGQLRTYDIGVTIVPDADSGIDDREPGPRPDTGGVDDGLLRWYPPPQYREIQDYEDKVHCVSSKSIAAIGIPGMDFRWMLITQVEPVSKEKKRKFRTKVNKLKRKLKVSNIFEILDSEEGTSGLLECYDEIWKNNNLTSMSLYIGPEKHTPKDVMTVMCRDISFRNKSLLKCDHCNYMYECFPYCLVGDKHDFDNLSLSGGWMLTGDQNFAVKRRVNNFKKKYKDYFEFVNVLMMPHHGSKHNVIPGFLNNFKNLDVCYAAAGPDNLYGHPHLEAKLMVHHPTSFLIVDTDQETTLGMRCCVCRVYTNST